MSLPVPPPFSLSLPVIPLSLSLAWDPGLHGWIAFRVPGDAHVDRIELTVGFNKKAGGVDLFTANHRITRVRIVHDAAPLKEVALDPNVRELQSIPIDGPGGDYEVRVLETLPGTNAAWRELTVSEFRVIGKPGAKTREPDDPLRVVAGSLDSMPAPFVTQSVGADTPTYSDISALCAAWTAQPPRQVSDRMKEELEHRTGCGPSIFAEFQAARGETTITAVANLRRLAKAMRRKSARRRREQPVRCSRQRQVAQALLQGTAAASHDDTDGQLPEVAIGLPR